MSKLTKYGVQFNSDATPLDIEIFCIRNGGQWTNKAGRLCGNGLFHHYKAMQRLLWPEDDSHRWSDLFLQEIVANKMLGVMGPANSNKTYSASRFALCDYWAFPDETLIMISSTDVRGLELRVWGAIKDLFNRARDYYPELPGVVLESMHCITTDSIYEGSGARVLKKGIICIPCLQGGRYTGLGKYVGVKQKRVRLIADECQVMGPSFLDATSNLGSNQDFKGVFLGNPLDPTDPLGMACEPEDGWMGHPEPTKTEVWRTRFQGGKCINFVGTDSPNFDFPDAIKPRYPYLIHKWRIEEVASFWGKDSEQYYSQAVGVMKGGLISKRVITRQLCQEHHALEKAVWDGADERIKIYAVDAAYSGVGGDRCVGGWVESGLCIDGYKIIKVNEPEIIQISINSRESPEDQIANHVKRVCDLVGIEPENVFYDSTGRGTLGSALARIFGTRTPVPVEFGGRPSTRPVRHDLLILDEEGIPRHKRCDEHYLDFVSELWYSSRYVIECDQMRELPEDVMREGCSREYGRTYGNRIFVESKHDPKARERMKRSPDLYDWLVTAIEGCRRRGFEIMRLGGTSLTESVPDDYLDRESRRYDQLMKDKLLAH